MDYEEKYKTALEMAKGIINYYKSRNRNEAAIEDLQVIFPELKESEDERIRETLIKFHKSTIDIDGIKGKDIISLLEKQGNKPKQTSIWKHWKDGIAGNGEGEPIYLVKNGNTYSLNSCLGCECDYIELSELDKLMLEKQGEQKPANKIEQTFHEGDWIVFKNDICQIVKREEGRNKLVTIFGIEKELVNERNLSTARLWTIQDAKDGDMLYLQHDGKEHIIIYKGVIKERFRTFVSAYCAYNGIVDAFCFADVSRYADIAYGGIMPATKEQRDLLFQKMKEEGYEWDEEKKKLEKIDSGKESESKKEEKSYNTEECNCIIQDTISICEQARKNATNEIDYENTTRCIGWLKILKYRHTYKPSKEQMDTLLFISSVLKDEQVIVNLEELKTLYNDLKKL